MLAYHPRLRFMIHDYLRVINKLSSYCYYGVVVSAGQSTQYVASTFNCQCGQAPSGLAQPRDFHSREDLVRSVSRMTQPWFLNGLQ